MKRAERIKAICPQCDNQFELKRYLAKKPTKYGRFCSMSCRSKYVAQFNPASQSKSISIECGYCSKVFKIQPYRLKDKVFCSRSCAAKYGLGIRWPNGPKMATVSCSYCGKEKAIPKWDLRCKAKKGQEQFFCDRKCFGKWKSANWCLENNPSWKGGWTPHGKGWEIISEQVRTEQEHKCADCGISQDKLDRKLDVHHIIPARLFKRKADSCVRPNLIALCHSCHMKRERDIPPASISPE